MPSTSSTTLAATPKDAIIAGHPNLMDNVPTFARRRALVTYKLAHPWSKGFWQRIEPRLEDLFAAYYAADPPGGHSLLPQISNLLPGGGRPPFSRSFWPEAVFSSPWSVGSRNSLARPWTTGWIALFLRLSMQRSAVSPTDAANFPCFPSSFFPAVVLDKHLRLLDMRSFLK